MGKKRKLKVKKYELEITDFSDECRGIAKLNDKIIFVNGALKGETVLAQRYKRTAKFEEANTLEILSPSAIRINAKCKFYGICGGCSLQHLASDNQLKLKLEKVQNMFARHTIKVEKWLMPITSDSWGYRRRARLGVRFVTKKNKVLVGFRERKSAFLADMDACEVLHPIIGKNLGKLSSCIEKLSIKSKVAQLEIAISEADTAVILRNLEILSLDDKKILQNCADEIGIKWYQQSGGINTISALEKEATLAYSHPKHHITIDFLVNDFTQINFELNQKMVDLAIDFLALKPTDNVIDLFCGLGNFTLPMARYAKSVVGIEGDDGLIQRAKHNAIKNKINNTEFFKADLLSDVSGCSWVRHHQYNKALIDPARNGALKIIALLPKFGVKKIVYISCNPATLVRDSKKLLELGYTLKQATIMDMFAQTAHVESIAVFTKKS